MKKNPKGKYDDNCPLPKVVDDFLSMDEAVELLTRYQPLLRDSMEVKTTADHNRWTKTSGKAAAKKSEYRTSRSIRLPPLGDALVFEIEARAANLSQTGRHYQVEDFQLACYHHDELYGLHRDDNDHPQHNADRSATVLIYLQEPGSGGGGGATLFTNRPLEIERDSKGKTLSTEAAALQLFRNYCANPQKHHLVVEPKVGRAVTWRNYNDDNQFCKSSTHGACPVIFHDDYNIDNDRNKPKCVIQQWMTRTRNLPLRDPRVVAIFPAGADLSFRIKLEPNKIMIDQQQQHQECLLDVSTNQGQFLPKLCPPPFDSYSYLDSTIDGPYKGVGGIRLYDRNANLPIQYESMENRGRLTGNFALRQEEQGALSVSFWARNIRHGTTIVALEKDGQQAVSFQWRRSGSDARPELAMQLPGMQVEKSATINPAIPLEEDEWLWFSLTANFKQQPNKYELFVHDIDGEPMMRMIGKYEGSACTFNYVGGDGSAQIRTNDNDDGNFTLSLFALAPVENDGITAIADVSFIVLQKGSDAIDYNDLVGLRKQIRRYDVNL